MKTSLQNKFFVLIIFLFVVLIAACGQTNKNIQVSTNTKTSLPAPPSQTLTPKASSTKNLMSTQTPSSDDATFSAIFVTSKARTGATQVSALVTLEARKAKCKEGFVVEQPLDILIDSNDKWTLFTCSPVPTNKNDKWTPGVVDYGTRYTQIIKTDLSKTWTIQHSTFDYSIIDRPDALMTPFIGGQRMGSIYIFIQVITLAVVDFRNLLSFMRT